jgi:hypothetical protein
MPIAWGAAVHARRNDVVFRAHRDYAFSGIRQRSVRGMMTNRVPHRLGGTIPPMTHDHSAPDVVVLVDNF